MSDSFTPIAASESKATFMTSIGLQAGVPEHERLYKLMKEDAVNAYRRVVKDRQATSSESPQPSTSKPRFAYTQIEKDIIRDAIVSIYEQASDDTKVFYDRGIDPDRESNWVIRWLLWHTFRYRDSRNKRPSTAQTLEASASSDAPDNATEPKRRSESADPTSPRDSRSLPYDPVRG